MNIGLNKNKSIGKVLFIVEGAKTEPYLLGKIFTEVFDYQMEQLLRNKRYRKYNSKSNRNSQVFVINAEESNIRFIKMDNEYLNNMFRTLIEDYDFNIDNAAIYYLFDRDNMSNTDTDIIRSLLSEITNARDNPNCLRQGLLLLSYPSIESFSLSSFLNNSFESKFSTGKELKQFLHEQNINNQNLIDDTICTAVTEMLNAFSKIGVSDFDIDDFESTNSTIFNYEENVFSTEKLYRALSLVCISLLDLGLIELA